MNQYLFFTSVLAVHVAAGSAGLAAMWIPLIARKGGPAHRRAGWLFVVSMGTVAATAIVLAAARLFLDPRPEAKSRSVFLLYVAVLTAAAVSSGIRALRFKHRTAAHHHWWDIGLAGLLTASGVGVAVFGIVQQQPLFIAFSLIGMLNGPANLRYWLRPPTDHMHWWFGHMNGMLGGCIAATTAFVVANGGHFGLPQLAAWLTPPAIGSIASAVWTRYYRRRFTVRAGRSDTSRRAPAADPDTLAHTA